MTVFAHAAQAYLISNVLGLSDAVTAVNVCSAVIPDVASIGSQYRGDFRRYEELHSLRDVGLIFFPGWALHNAVDFFTHSKLGGWYWWTYYLEALWWIVFGLWFFHIV